MKSKKAKKSEEEMLDEITEETDDIEVLDSPPERTEADEAMDKYRRCLAEFDNFRKRTTKEMAARYDDGVRAACEKLLPIVDNFERALSSAADKEGNFYKGIEMIARQLEGTFTELGATPIEIEPGTTFDPNLHHAVAHTEDENFGENQVAEVLQKGYIHKERVIRPAMVKVAN